MLLQESYLHYIEEHDKSANRWSKLRTDGPGAYRFWYRQSPRYFDTFDDIAADKPALDVSGMASVYLDMSGRLHWFVAVPPQREPATTNESPPDWSVAFREAGLEMANFKPVASTSVPLHAYDVRAAWEGGDPNHPELRTHVEAAAFRGKLTYFETIYPWDQATRQDQATADLGGRILELILIAVYLVALIGSVILARRNLKLGRGDRRGAMRLALVYFTVRIALWLFVQHHNALLYHEFLLLIEAVSRALFTSGFLAMLYLALEPLVRRRWPHRIISWSRLLAGDYSDPLVGRDILIGSAFGACMILCAMMTGLVQRWVGQPPILSLNPAGTTMGAHLFVSRFASQLTAAFFITFITMLLLWLFVSILRNERVALVALWLLITVIQTLLSGGSLVMVPFTGLLAAISLFVLYRFGLLALMLAVFILHLWVFLPMTTELTAWYALDFTIALGIALALVLYGFYRSLAGQPILSGRLLREDSY